MDTPGGLDRLPEGPVRRMFAAAHQKNLDEMVAQFSHDYVNITPNHPARGFTGRGQVRSNWSQIFEAVPDLTLHVLDAIAADDKVWVEWTLHGARRDGIRLEQAGVAIFTVREDRLSTVRFYLEPVEYGSGDADAAVRAATGAEPEGARP